MYLNKIILSIIMSQNLKIILSSLVIVLIVSLSFGGVIYFNAQKNSKNDTTAKSSSEPSKIAGPEKLLIEDLQVGQGVEVKQGDNITVNYAGTLTDGTKFDSSYDRNEPFTTQIGVGKVIPGWDQGMIGMKKGGKRKLTIPSDLAYGAQAAGQIPPNSTLIFEIEMLGINDVK